jgi:hypothetical protein
MIDAALAKLIRAAAGAGTTVHPSTEVKPLTSALPRIIYTQIDEEQDYCDDGETGLVRAVYQLDFFDQQVTAAKAKARTVRQALRDLRGLQEGIYFHRFTFSSGNFAKGEKLDGDNKTIGRFSQDLEIQYREPA